MAKKFLKITSASNEEGNDLFNAICKDILNKKTSEVRNELGLPIATKVTTKDLITLIQEKGLECEIIVKYEEKVSDDLTFT